MNAAEFNALYEVGVPVFAFPGARPEDDAKATRLVTRTRSKASLLSGHTDVVWVDGHSACIALTHVDVVTEAEWEAAKQQLRHDELVALRNDALNVRGVLSPNGGTRKVPMPLGETLTPAVEWLVNRVAELEAERHTANEALDDAATALREQRDRIAALEAAAVEGRAALAAFCHDLQDPGTAALGALFLLQQATIGAPMQPGETVPKVYRAQHDSIAMGLYTTATEARAHCVAEERRTWSTGANPVFDWIEDEEDGVAELVTVAEDGETETVTGYIVTALEVAAAYDPDADE
ncbi:hypothetical protein ABZ608_42420 [Streptomyces sp. NPDC013172]|uniref:Uncharacterized protein n=1 Tax=Streptomyces atriruber TaxID=545121 RepID=A0ABV3C140_9ACTN